MERKGVRKGGISINICKRVEGGKRVASLKYAFRLISVAGDCNRVITYYLESSNTLRNMVSVFTSFSLFFSP
jgi:hypothetical protein